MRVAGYGAMFVKLSKAIQDDIINRFEHVLSMRPNPGIECGRGPEGRLSWKLFLRSV